jgi:hypothetical protein
MAKKALLDVLEQTIGKYVKNLDAESLNVAVWSGKIELHSLELDVRAVNSELDRQAAETPNLAVPFKVVSGSFEGLEIDVPWSALMSRPVILRARGLKVFIEPCDRLAQADHLLAVVANEEKRAAKIREARKQSIEQSDKYRLHANAMRKLAEADLEASGKGGKHTSSSFSSRLVRRIIENIQIEVSDVHVCLNDMDGSAGVVLNSLSLVTTDKAGKRTFVDRTAMTGSVEDSFLYKQLQINGFGVYLNQTENPYNKLVPVTEDGPFESSDDVSGHSYILAPLSFQATLRQADGRACIDYAKYLLSSELSSLSILLSRSQLDLARKISKKVVADTKGPLFPEYRPLTRVTKETAVDWWKYALRCVGRLNGTRSWVEFFLAYKIRKKYIPLYKRHAHQATCSWIKPLTSTENDELLAIEGDRSISTDGIMSWRNIADAQMEKEKEKHLANKSTKEQSYSVFSSIFGSRDTASVKQADAEEPPIHLSVDELKALEDMSKLDFADDDVSKDSKLYDVKFILSSFKVNLTAYDLRHLAALDMGTVSADFNASADGAYAFKFMLASLEVKDMVTPNSLFQSVLRSTGANTVSQGATPLKDEVFKVHMEKTKTGDQQLFVRLAQFEMVASPILLREVKRFFSDSSYNVSSNRNPLLAQSLSGSVDLFYDADEGSKPLQSFGITEDKSYHAAPQTNDLSNRLIDAWNDKKETKAKWVMDVDINAPVVIIPEKCSDPLATVLAFDLGRLKLHYGKINAAQQVEEWLLENPRQTRGDIIRDSGSLEISDLTFMVGKANYWHRLLQKKGQDDDSAVVEPISISLDFAVESVQGEDMSRVCCFGVIPTISLKLSPSQGSRIFAVINAWTSFLDEIKDNSKQPETPVEPEIGQGELILGNQAVVQLASKFAGSSEAADCQASSAAAHPIFHLVMGLQRLSVTAVPTTGSKMEAHLVSVYASTSLMSDGSSVSQLRMGWFWVLDQLQGNFVRRQRLVAHSNLPLSPESYALTEKYAILDTLTELGVFEREFLGSTELADVTLKIPPSGTLGSQSVDVSESVLDINFSSLFVHWNPNAIKACTGMVEKFNSLVQENAALAVERGGLILSPGKRYTPKNAELELQDGKTKETKGRMVVKARMERLDINLNSALDDHPLFVLTMSRAQVNIEPSKSDDEGMTAALVLGDLRMRTPDMGRTLPAYRTLIGLAPGRSDSLLTIKYCVGASSIATMSVPTIDTSRLEACAEVELSPMRIVYIHAQIMALVEYITEGILGALAARAASSAAEAAKEMANSVVGEKFFLVKATAFDLILPQAATSEKVISIHAGSLNVGYRMFPVPGGGEANVSLADVSLKSTLGKPLQEKPIRMDIFVKLPPDEVGTFEDQAMRITIDTSQATFLVSKSQYAQILRTLSENMGDGELYLRDNRLEAAPSQLVSRKDETQGASSDSVNADMTHAGVAAVIKLRRLYLNVKVSILALELCGLDMLDPIIRIAAVNCGVNLKQIPDEERMSCDVSLGNLVCNDRRAIANSRQYRSLIDQRISEGTNKAEDMFYVEYKSERLTTQIDLKVGSPIVVFIPDAISEVLGFLRVMDDSPAVSYGTKTGIAEAEPRGTERQVVRLDATETSEAIEATIHPTSRGDLVSTMLVSLKTDKCQFVLVDLGSQCSGLESPVTGKAPPLAETIVVQGMFAATLSMTTDVKSNEMITADLESQADAMEAFTAFGSDMKSPLQILDPAEFSAHGSIKTTDLREMHVELRAAALTPFEVVFSMHNAALLNAILNGLQESFSRDILEETDGFHNSLNANETKRIEDLASALETVNTKDTAVNHQLSSMDDTSKPIISADSTKASSSLRVELKLTMPETRVTVINDLQGLDEALFRVTVSNFVAGGHVNNGGSTGETTFDFHLNTSILADYFDSSPNLWNVLLIKPWEITLKGVRAPSARFSSKRLSTTIDLESFPCCISFSEQFLASLAGAKRMWSIYSTATTPPVVEVRRLSAADNTDATLRRSMAASAARNLVTSLPYAVENHSGFDASFLLPGPREACRKCPNGTIQYFRFDPPRGKGFGGNRLYGQDVQYGKSLTLFFNDVMVQIGHLDSELASPRRAHELGDGRVLLTHVAREGKTIVRTARSTFRSLNMSRS